MSVRYRPKSNSVVEVKPSIFISYVVTLRHPVLDAMSKYGAASLVQEINTAISGQVERHHAIVFSTPFCTWFALLSSNNFERCLDFSVKYLV